MKIILHKNEIMKYILILFLVFSQYSCSFFGGDSKEVKRRELIGNWMISQESLELMKKKNICCPEKKVSLQLLENGRFLLKNMPDCWQEKFGRCFGKVKSHKGNWKLWRLNEHDNYSLILKIKNRTVSMGISRSILTKDALYIGYVFGDPDINSSYYLVKNENESQ